MSWRRRSTPASGESSWTTSTSLRRWPAWSPLAPARPVSIWLRLSPGVQAHTHAHIQTGQVDTKFGFDIKSGDAERAIVAAMQTPGLSLVGLHAHIGSQIYEAEDHAVAAAKLIEFAAQMRDRHGFVLQELSPGGGWGVPMTETDPPAPIEPYIAMLCEAVAATCREAGLALPHLVLEPGRSLVAPAAVALYTVGARKEIPGVRTYVSVDGGMADNIRPALYGAQYAALQDWPIRNPQPTSLHSGDYSPKSEIVTIAGKFCESGDILIRDIELPRLDPGDLLAIPMAGAYTLAMSSNYNLARRPAVVLVNQGEARLIQRREAFDALLARDLPLHRDAKRAARRRSGNIKRSATITSCLTRRSGRSRQRRSKSGASATATWASGPTASCGGRSAGARLSACGCSIPMAANSRRAATVCASSPAICGISACRPARTSTSIRRADG